MISLTSNSLSSSSFPAFPMIHSSQTLPSNNAIQTVIGTSCLNHTSPSSKRPKLATRDPVQIDKESCSRKILWNNLLKDTHSTSKSLIRTSNYARIAQGLLPFSEEEKALKELNPDHFNALKDSGFIDMKEIGQGSCSYILQATNSRDSKECAIKISKSMDRNINIILESKILQHIKNQSTEESKTHIIESEPFFILGDRVVFSLELCQTDLYKLSFAPNKISLFHISQIAKQAFETLSFLHSIDVIHADIRPDNILIKHTNPLQIKLADFGLAQSSLSKTSLLLQTLEYRSPEVILRKNSYTYAIDTWSLGCVLIEIKKTTNLFSYSTDTVENEIALLTDQQHLLGPYPEALPENYPAAEEQTTSIADHINKSPLYFYDNRGKKDELIDLAEKMLKFKPEERISPEEALNHPFLNLDGARL